MNRAIAIVSLSALLTACGEAAVNPPTEPAEAVETAPGAAPAAQRPVGVGALTPDTGPTSFVGRWAADVAWCPNTQGAERPIEITTTVFIGYENRCRIDAIEERADGYVATLACAGEGMTSRERVRMGVDGQSMRLTYMDRDNATVTLTKCTTLGDTAQTAPTVKLD